MKQDYQGEYMPRTKLDYAIEYVEHKYQSLSKAPMSAIYWIRSVGLNGGMKKYNSHESMERIPKDSDLKLRNIKGNLVTNNKHLVATCKWVNEGKPIKMSCELGGFSYGQFNNLHLTTKYYIYSYGKIHFKFHTYRKMIQDMKAMSWKFAPTKMSDVKNHNYQGKIKTVIHCCPVSYRRVLV